MNGSHYFAQDSDLWDIHITWICIYNVLSIIAMCCTQYLNRTLYKLSAYTSVNKRNTHTIPYSQEVLKTHPSYWKCKRNRTNHCVVKNKHTINQMVEESTYLQKELITYIFHVKIYKLFELLTLQRTIKLVHI